MLWLERLTCVRAIPPPAADATSACLAGGHESTRGTQHGGTLAPTGNVRSRTGYRACCAPFRACELSCQARVALSAARSRLGVSSGTAFASQLRGSVGEPPSAAICAARSGCHIAKLSQATLPARQRGFAGGVGSSRACPACDFVRLRLVTRRALQATDLPHFLLIETGCWRRRQDEGQRVTCGQGGRVRMSHELCQRKGGVPNPLAALSGVLARPTYALLCYAVLARVSRWTQDTGRTIAVQARRLCAGGTCRQRVLRRVFHAIFALCVVACPGGPP